MFNPDYYVNRKFQIRSLNDPNIILLEGRIGEYLGLDKLGFHHFKHHSTVKFNPDRQIDCEGEIALRNFVQNSWFFLANNRKPRSQMLNYSNQVEWLDD